MLSLNTGWEMMNDYVKHIISPLHHHCNMTAKFHSSYPISSLFKERKLLVPVIRYVAGLCARVKPTPIRLSALLLHTGVHARTHTERGGGVHMFHTPDPLSSHIPFHPFQGLLFGLDISSTTSSVSDASLKHSVHGVAPRAARTHARLLPARARTCARTFVAAQLPSPPDVLYSQHHFQR